MDYETFEGRVVPNFTEEDYHRLSTDPEFLSRLIEEGCDSDLTAVCTGICCQQCLLEFSSALADYEQRSKLVEIRRRYFAERLGAKSSDKAVYVCNRYFGAEERCPEGPCEIKLKAGVTPNSGLCPVASGKGQPLWHQPGDAVTEPVEEEEVEPAGATISEAVIDAAPWAADTAQFFLDRPTWLARQITQPETARD